MLSSSINKISKELAQGDYSSFELTQYCIGRIEKYSRFNAFIQYDAELALNAAKRADSLIRKNEQKALTGIPMALKDLFCTTEMTTTCGSKMLANFSSPYDATVSTLLKNQGAVLLGKTNMDEFAMGSSNETSFFGPVLNPWDSQYCAGGSSGGSAAAVAADLAVYSIGSDTGGSVRQPAAFCGVSGLKPTYGLISRHGMIAYASSFDQAGPIARSAEDLAIILECLASYDAKDSTSIDNTTIKYSQEIEHRPPSIRVGIPKSFFNPDVDIKVQEAIRNAMHILEKQGATFVELDLKLQEFWVPCYYVLACAEASSNLSRYDGVRFGYRSKQADTLNQLIKSSRTEGFGEEVKRRILTGTHVLSTGFYEAYYLQAQKIRRLIQQELLNLLSSVDLILGPTTPTPAFELNKKSTNPVQNYLADIFTVAANLAGLPALSIPVGFKQKLPIGMQLMAKPFDELLLLQCAHQYQNETDWHLAKALQE